MNILMWGIGVVKDHWISINKEDSCTFWVGEKLIDFRLDPIYSGSPFFGRVFLGEYLFCANSVLYSRCWN